MHWSIHVVDMHACTGISLQWNLWEHLLGEYFAYSAGNGMPSKIKLMRTCSIWRAGENRPGGTKLHSLLQHHSAPECSLVLLLSYTYYKLNWAVKWDKLRMKPGSEPGFESSWCLFLTILISLNACFGSKYRILHLEENHDTRRNLYFPITPNCRLQTADSADHADRADRVDWVFFFPFFRWNLNFTKYEH